MVYPRMAMAFIFWSWKMDLKDVKQFKELFSKKTIFLYMPRSLFIFSLVISTFQEPLVHACIPLGPDNCISHGRGPNGLLEWLWLWAGSVHNLCSLWGMDRLDCLLTKLFCRINVPSTLTNDEKSFLSTLPFDKKNPLVSTVLFFKVNIT